MLASWRVTLAPCFSDKRLRSGFCCRADALQSHANGGEANGQMKKKKKKKVVIVGSGWAGLGAAYHLCNQGFDVTVIEGSPEDVGIRGYWSPYQNIFSLVDELGIRPFTNWTASAHYSGEGLEVEFPIFKDLPQLPTPLGTLFYTQFARLPLVDRLTSLPLGAAVIDFDNTETAWRQYDSTEQCSAAATLAVLFYILAHQKDFDLVLCRGTVKEKIFEPLIDFLRSKGCEILEGKKVTDFFFNEEEPTCISEVVCGRESYNADAVILAVGISRLQELVKNSAVLCTREEFLKVLNLTSIDVVTVKLRLDRKVKIPNASNACSGFDEFGWTFFDLNIIHDEHKDDPVTVLQADFYHSNELLPMKDEDIVAKVMSYLSKCIKDFEHATVMDKEIGRFPQCLTHFFPGSYKYMMRGSTSFPNFFMAGDWIITRHGSWSQEKSYVTGLEAANRVVDYLEEGSFAKIIPLEEEEPHIQVLRSLNRRFNEFRDQVPLSNFFLQ
ncbi:uncharacterized protein LOC132189608 isoform X2 [Corylus avellana]|uniref:uncharacterized protein LOC132189608 isoform X2 n=1 Tax=Corylus avellana TaxID=13451 RepID=UPI00286B441C|nr:uncharacterized protein LOC132189608 isoform X2 [Corylus avellana]